MRKVNIHIVYTNNNDKCNLLTQMTKLKRKYLTLLVLSALVLFLSVFSLSIAGRVMEGGLSENTLNQKRTIKTMPWRPVSGYFESVKDSNYQNELKNKIIDIQMDDEIKKRGTLRLDIPYDGNWGELPDVIFNSYSGALIVSDYFKTHNENNEWQRYYILKSDEIEKFAINCDKRERVFYYSLKSDIIGEFGYPIDYKIKRIGGGEVEKHKTINSIDNYIYQYMCEKNEIHG